MVTKSKATASTTAANAEVLKTLRAAHAAKPKATVTSAPEAEAVRAIAPDPEAAFSFDFRSLLIGEASWKRAACAVVASLATSAAVGYLGGYLLAYLTLGAAVLTGSMFITLLIYVLGVLLIMYVGYRASALAYMKVIDKSVDRTCSAAYSWATSLFNTKEVTA